MTKEWRVETKATVRRVYFVQADNDHDARAAIGSVLPELEEDENEETIDLRETAGAR